MGTCITRPLGKVNPFTVMSSEHSRLVLQMCMHYIKRRREYWMNVSKETVPPVWYTVRGDICYRGGCCDNTPDNFG